MQDIRHWVGATKSTVLVPSTLQALRVRVYTGVPATRGCSTRKQLALNKCLVSGGCNLSPAFAVSSPGPQELSASV